MKTTTNEKTQKSSRVQTQREFQPEEALAANSNKPAIVTIGRSRDEVYDFLSDFSNLPKFKENVLSVVVDGKKSRWTVQAANKTEVLSSEITRAVRGKSLEWMLAHEDGSSELCRAAFYDDTRGGCVVTLELGQTHESGRITGIISFFMGKSAKSQATITLRRLKALLETGEIATIAGQSSGRAENTH